MDSERRRYTRRDFLRVVSVSVGVVLVGEFAAGATAQPLVPDNSSTPTPIFGPDRMNNFLSATMTPRSSVTTVTEQLLPVQSPNYGEVKITPTPTTQVESDEEERERKRQNQGNTKNRTGGKDDDHHRDNNGTNPAPVPTPTPELRFCIQVFPNRCGTPMPRTR